MSFVPPDLNSDGGDAPDPPEIVPQDDQQLSNDPDDQRVLRPYRSNYRRNYEPGQHSAGRSPVVRFYGRTFSNTGSRGKWKPNNYRPRNFSTQQNSRDVQLPQNDPDPQQIPAGWQENAPNENIEEVVIPRQLDTADNFAPELPMQTPPIPVQTPQIPMQTPPTPVPMPMQALALNIPGQGPLSPHSPMPYMFSYGQQQQPNWPLLIPQSSPIQAPQGPPVFPVAAFRYSQSSPTVYQVHTQRGSVHYYDYNPVYPLPPNYNPGPVGPLTPNWQNQPAMTLNGAVMVYSGYPGNEMAQNGQYGMNFRYENNYYSPNSRY